VPTLAHCCYTHRTRTNGPPWTDDHHCVNKFKNALKERSINAYANLLVIPGKPRRLLNQATAASAFKWFGEMSAPWLVARMIKKPVIIPIPNSKSTVKTKESRLKKLADGLAEHGDGEVLDVLRFDKEYETTGNGGSREPEDIYPTFRLIGEIPKDRPVVLVDDVLTKGGHIRAAVAYLRRKGVTAEIVACCGVSAEMTPSPTPLNRVVRELPDYVDARKPR